MFVCVGVERRGRGRPCPLDFEIICKKRLFFQFRGVKNKFHHFWHPLEKILGKSPTAPPLEKILPTPMFVSELYFDVVTRDTTVALDSDVCVAMKHSICSSVIFNLLIC